MLHSSIAAGAASIVGAGSASTGAGSGTLACAVGGADSTVVDAATRPSATPYSAGPLRAAVTVAVDASTSDTITARPATMPGRAVRAARA